MEEEEEEEEEEEGVGCAGAPLMRSNSREYIGWNRSNSGKYRPLDSVRKNSA